MSDHSRIHQSHCKATNRVCGTGKTDFYPLLVVTRKFYFIHLFTYLYVCVSVCVRAYKHTCVWRLQMSFPRSLLSYFLRQGFSLGPDTNQLGKTGCLQKSQEFSCPLPSQNQIIKIDTRMPGFSHGHEGLNSSPHTWPHQTLLPQKLWWHLLRVKDYSKARSIKAECLWFIINLAHKTKLFVPDHFNKCLWDWGKIKDVGNYGGTWENEGASHFIVGLKSFASWESRISAHRDNNNFL